MVVIRQYYCSEMGKGSSIIEAVRLSSEKVVVTGFKEESFNIRTELNLFKDSKFEPKCLSEAT